jgi:hypothetical protein
LRGLFGRGRFGESGGGAEVERGPYQNGGGTEVPVELLKDSEEIHTILQDPLRIPWSFQRFLKKSIVPIKDS